MDGLGTRMAYVQEHFLLEILVVVWCNVKGRVVRIVCIVEVGIRMHGEQGMKDPVSQDLGSSAVPRP